MDEPYMVLSAGTFAVWCRRCSWRSRPCPISSFDPLVFAAVVAVSAADWRDHACLSERARRAPVTDLGEVEPAPVFHTGVA